MKFHSHLFLGIISITLFSCQKELPIYNVYNGLIIGEQIPKTQRVSVPDSLNAFSFTALKNKGSHIFYYKKKYEDKEYEAIIDRRGRDGVISEIYIYFTGALPNSEECYDEQKDNLENPNHPIRNCLLYENPEYSAINPSFEKYLKQMLIDKYGDSFEFKEFSPSTYVDEEVWNKDAKIQEFTWRKDYLQIKLVSMRDNNLGFMRLGIYYSLSKNYFTDFKTNLNKIKEANSNF